MTKIMILSILMMLVTAPSRILPAFFQGERQLPPFAESFLKYIPYAILGALIFPDILTATGDKASSAAGAITALLLSLFGKNILIVLTGAILAAYAVRHIMM